MKSSEIFLENLIEQQNNNWANKVLSIQSSKIIPRKSNWEVMNLIQGNIQKGQKKTQKAKLIIQVKVM